MTTMDNDILGSISITSQNKMSATFKIASLRDNDIPTNISIFNFNDLPSSLTINSPYVVGPSGPMYQLNSSVSVPFRNDLYSTIRVKPHNKMRAVVEIVQPPTTAKKITRIKDTLINSGSPTLNYGRDMSMLIGQYNGELYNSILQFDILDIPENQIITNGKVKIYKSNYSLPGTLKVYSVQGVWDETSTTWKNSPQKGDLVTSVNIPSHPGYIEVDILSLVQTWYNNPIGNTGIILEQSNNDSQFTMSASTDNVMQFNTAQSSTNAPEVTINYYDESATFSFDKYDMPSHLAIRQQNSKDVASHLYINSTYGAMNIPSHLIVNRYETTSDIPTNINIRKVAIDSVDSSVVVSKPELKSHLYVKYRKDLSSHLAIRVKDLSSIPSNIIVNRPEVHSKITIRQHRDEDINVSIAIRRSDIDDIQSNVSVSRPDLTSHLYVRYNEDIDSSITVRQNVDSDIPSNVSVSRPDLISNVIVFQNDSISSSITVVQNVESNIPSSISVKQFVGNDIPSSITSRVRDVSEIQTSINIIRSTKDQNDIPSSIAIEQTDESDIQSSVAIQQTDNNNISSSISIEVRNANEIPSSITIKKINQGYAFIM